MQLKLFYNTSKIITTVPSKTGELYRQRYFILLKIYYINPYTLYLTNNEEHSSKLKAIDWKYQYDTAYILVTKYSITVISVHFPDYKINIDYLYK